MLSLLPINKVQTLGLNLTIHKGTDKTSDDLLRLGMLIDLACMQKDSVGQWDDPGLYGLIR